MRILIILPSFPFPPVNGQEHRFAAIARHLARTDEVSLVCLSDQQGIPETAQLLRNEFVELHRLARDPWTLGARLSSTLSREPAGVRRLRSGALQRRIDTLIHRHRPEVIIAGDPGMTRYLEGATGTVTILDYVCELMLQAERFAAVTRGPERLLWLARRDKYAAFLRRIEPSYRLCLVNSPEDRDSLARVWPTKKIHLFTNGLDPAEYTVTGVETQSTRLIFPGSVTYAPNRDAVQYFLSDIMPRIRQRVPDAELVVSGALPADGSEPRGEGIRYLGHVENVRLEIAKSSVCVVPLRLGAGGARFKILESLALRIPVVCTSVGCEGLAAQDGVHLLRSDDPETFAAKTAELLEQPTLRARIAGNGRALFEREYDWRVLGARLRGLLASHVERSRAGL